MFLIIIALGLVRFLWLGQFPPGLSNDETEYILSAKTYAMFDRDVSGYGLPLSLFKSETDDVIAPVPSVASSVFFNFLPLNLTTARIPYVLVSSITAAGVFYLSLVLFKNQTLSLLTVIVFMSNPWAFYMSRNTADAPFALMFYVWGTALFIKNNGKRIFIPFLLFVLGFFSYHGAKTVFLPLVFVLAFYLWGVAKKISIVRAGIFVALASLFFVSFVAVSSRMPGSLLDVRSDDVLFDATSVSQMVDNTRTHSVVTPTQSIFINKYEVVARTLFERYLGIFNLETFFISGDPRSTYHFGGYGLFHIVDLVFLVIGVVAMVFKKHKGAVLLGLILLIAPASSVASSVDISVINRSFLVLPIVVVCVSWGIYFMAISINKRLKNITVIALAAIVFASYLSFLNFYFFSFPVTSQENYWVSERALVQFLSKEKAPSVWVSREPWNSTMRMIFYSNQKDQESYLSNVYPLNQKINYTINNTTITPKCPDRIDPGVVYAVSEKTNCDLGQPSMVIEDHKDAGHVIAIYNSESCSNLTPYRRFHYLSDYKIESMDTKTLCERWFNSIN